MGRFELYLTTDAGQRIAELSTGLGVSGSKIANGVGSFQYNAPRSFNRNLVRPDQLFQIWYEPDGGALELFNTYLLRTFNYQSKSFSFGGPDMNSLLTRRIVAAYSTTAPASKSAMEADYMMAVVVAESLEDTAEPLPVFGTRAWNNLTVDTPPSLGPVISSSFPFKKLLTMDGGGVLPIIAKAAKERGQEVFFAIQPNVVGKDSINFVFRTSIGLPPGGVDVSSKVTFDEASGNLINPNLTINYEDEANYIYATGPGEETQRNVQQVYDATRMGQSIWGRIEAEADSRNMPDDDTAIADNGYSVLWDGRPKIRFTGEPADTDGTKFGKHWRCFDLVTTKFEVIQFKSIIRAVTLSINDQGETSVSTRLDFES